MTSLQAALLAWARVREVDGARLRSICIETLARAEHDADDDEALRELIAELRGVLPAALERAGFGAAPPATEEAASAIARTGAPGVDEAFATFLEQFGAPAREVATHVRDGGRARAAIVLKGGDAARLWALWLDEGNPFAISLAFALWLAVVQPRLEERRRRPAALVLRVQENAIDLHSSSFERRFDTKTQSLMLGRRVVAAVDLQAIEARRTLLGIDDGLDLLRTVVAHRVFRWEVLTAHARALMAVADPRLLDVDGGWSALTEMLELGRKYEHLVRRVVIAQAMWIFEQPDGTRGNLVSFEERPARGQRRARVTITVGPQLLPNFVHSVSGAHRKLVPMLRRDPPLYGSNKKGAHGAQLTMALALMALLRGRARELAANEGFVRLTDDDWMRLGDRSGVPRWWRLRDGSGLRQHLVPAVRDHWLAGDSRSPPLLVRSGDAYALADTHAAERAFLIEGGRLELDAAEAGRTSARRRRASRGASSDAE